MSQECDHTNLNWYIAYIPKLYGKTYWEVRYSNRLYSIAPSLIKKDITANYHNRLS